MAGKFKARALEPEFFESFKNGKLKKLLTVVKNDPNLIMCLRGNYTTIYYRGLQILKVNQDFTFEVDGNYGIEENFFKNNIAVISYKKGNPCYCFKPNIQEFGWVQYFKDIKYLMDEHCRKNQDKLEKEIQQIMFRENSYNSEANGTDYIIFDVENADDGARYDLLAVYWSRHSRNTGNKTQLAIIELKANIEAIKGTKTKDKETNEEIVSASLFEHYKDVKAFVRKLKDDKNEIFRKNFFADRKEVFTQMIDLGLINTTVKAEKLSIDKKDKSIQFISAIANYNDKSDELQKQIYKIVNQEITDPCNGMEVLFATSPCLGYGLYERYLLNSFEMLGKLPELKKEKETKNV